MASPRKNRGEYRPIYETLFHGKDYRRLSPEGKLTLLTLKGLCGAIGLKPWPALAETLSELTGIPLPKQKKAIADLKVADWIQYEDGMVWVMRGLEFEPHFTPGNENHRVSLNNIMDTLPRAPIVDRFRLRYSAFLGGVPDTMGEGMGDGIPPAMGEPTTTTTNTPSPTLTPTTDHDQRDRCRLSVVMAANSGITKQFGEQTYPIGYDSPSTNKFVDAILEAGVEVQFAAATVHEYAKSNRPSDGKAPMHMHYFTAHVIRRWKGQQANLQARNYVHNPDAAVRALPEVNAYHLQCIKYAQDGSLEYQVECQKLGLVWVKAS